MTAPQTQAVMAALTGDGPSARFVGGCVRDAVLGRASKDIDIATSHTPDRVIELLKAAGIGAVPTGIQHGTITAVADGQPFEVTTLREDVETMGRHAKVAFTQDWVGDASRRDFTINALYCDPDGTLYDPTGGLADLKAGRVRFVGQASQRIAEDYLRILRFFRIHAHYGKGAPDAEALAACKTHAQGLGNLSAERIAAELLRLLGAPNPESVMRLMEAAGVLAQVLPEATNFARLKGLTHLDSADPDPLRRLAAVIAVDAQTTEAMALRLKLSNDHRRRLIGFADLPPVSPEGKDPVLRRALYSVGRQKFQDDVYLRWAEDADGAQPGWLRVLNFPDTWAPPTFPLSGEDAMAAGIPQGPAIGEALSEIEAWWIAEDFQPDRAACLKKLEAAASA